MLKSCHSIERKDLEKAIQAIFKIEHTPPTMTRHFAEGIAAELFLTVILTVHAMVWDLGRDGYALKKAGLKWSYKQQTNMFHI